MMLSAVMCHRARRVLAIALLCAVPWARATEPDYPDATGRTSDNALTAVQIAADVALGALTYMGVPYRYGGDDPQTGFDCSGLVRHVYLTVAAVELPRRAEEQRLEGRVIKRADVAVGDLVFFNTRGRPFSHVAIYLGDGRFVHAPGRGGQVRVDELSEPYWRARYNGARRLLWIKQ